MGLDNTARSLDKSSANQAGAGLPLSEVIKEDRELTLLTSCFSTSSSDFVQYDVGTNHTLGSHRLVYFLNESTATDPYVIAFARGSLDEYSSQAFSLATKCIVERANERPVTRSIYCGLPETIDIAIETDLSPISNSWHERICLEPKDFSDYKTAEINGIDLSTQKFKVESAELADKIVLIKFSIGSRNHKVLLFDQGDGVRVALNDDYMSFPSESTDHIVRSLFPEVSTVLHRHISGAMVIAPKEVIKQARESKTLGTLNADSTLLPQLCTFTQDGNKVYLEYRYGAERFDVSGRIERRGKKSVLVAGGPKTTDDESERWLHDTLKKTVELKLPELGFISLEYKGTQPEKQMLPTLKSFEKLTAEDFLATFEGNGNPFQFHIFRPSGEFPILFISGRTDGKIADNWARMKIADIFSEKYPELPYNGAIFLEQ